MKLIKLLVTMSMLNALLVVGITKYVEQLPPDQSMQAVGKSSLDTSEIQPPPTLAPQSSTVPITPPKTSTPVSTTVPTSVPTPTPTPSIKPVSTPPPTVAPTSTPTPTPRPVGCVIRIDGVNYEITALRKSHPGGDIFQCGTDMSAIFWGQHNQKILQQMQAYRI